MRIEYNESQYSEGLSCHSASDMSGRGGCSSSKLDEVDKLTAIVEKRDNCKEAVNVERDRLLPLQENWDEQMPCDMM